MSAVDPAPVREPDPLRRAAQLLWPNLPLLLIGSIMIAAPWSVLRLLSPALGLWVLPAITLVVLPPLAALLSAVQHLLADEHVGPVGLLRSLPKTVRPVLTAAAPVTAALLLTAGSAEAWRLGQQTWMLLSVALSGALAFVAGLVGLVVLPYLLQASSVARQSRPTTAAPSPREAWLVGLFVLTRQPILIMGAAAAVVITVIAASYLSFAMIIVLPAPLALIWAAATEAAFQRSRDRLTRPGDTWRDVLSRTLPHS